MKSFQNFYMKFEHLAIKVLWTPSQLALNSVHFVVCDNLIRNLLKFFEKLFSFPKICTFEVLMMWSVALINISYFSLSYVNP